MDLHLRRRCRGRTPARLDVMTSFAGRDLDMVQVMILSLADAHPRDEIRFWLFEQNIPAPQIRALAEFCAGLGNVTLHPVRVPDAAAFGRLRELGGKPDSARFLWFVAHQHLPGDLDRVIYLDATDIIVAGDLVPLLHHPFMGKYLIACREFTDLPPLLIGGARRAHACGLPSGLIRHISRGLINSGAIVLNLRKLRRDGIGIGHYLDTAEWAHDRLRLGFGDQGLFSLTHGSHYTRLHDRYNHRFYAESPKRIMRDPAVIHFAGQVLKPAFWRLSKEHECLVLDRLRRSGSPILRLNQRLPLRAAHLPYLRRWWEICARTPSHARLEPEATARMTAALSQWDREGGTDPKATR
ncbi:MAG: glycosyltransferase [Paracoccus sp. (in: a-proteobacteria)]|uniref:glycosyltransferase family 8 protein n=1 Tax=Paracoccus sp. TaxID=267 RepID=UPI0039E71002